MIKIIIISDDSSFAETVNRSINSWNFPDLQMELSSDTYLTTIQGNFDLCIFDLPASDSHIFEKCKEIQTKLSLSALICIVDRRQLAFSVELYQLGWVYVHFREREIVEIKNFLDVFVRLQLDKRRFYSLEVNKHEIDPSAYTPYVFKSKVMLTELRKALIAANSQRNTLLLGETGVGKEIFAELIHRKSGRKGPLIKLNAAGLNEETSWSELFGHKKGSFSGAISDRDGYFSQANKGTLFLDEIGSLPMKVQAEVLRVIGDDNIVKFRKRGSDKVNEEESDVLVIAATNELSINSAINPEKFREDLFARFRPHIQIPPLRERQEDIPELIFYFLSVENLKNKTKIEITNEALNKIISMKFPYNIRSLKAIVLKSFDRVRYESRLKITTDDIEE